MTIARPQAAAAGKDVTVLGFKLHYLEAGRGAPIVLLHGLGGDGSRWGPNIEPLAKDFHVFALDQIGFGESDKPLANYHTGMLAEFLVGFLKAAGMHEGVTGRQFDGRRCRAVHRGALSRHGRPDRARRWRRLPLGGRRDGSAADAEALRRRQLQNSVTRDETREFFRILFHDKSLVTDKMVDEQLTLRLRAAFTITKMQEAGDRGSLTEQEVRARQGADAGRLGQVRRARESRRRGSAREDHSRRAQGDYRQLRPHAAAGTSRRVQPPGARFLLATRATHQ